MKTAKTIPALLHNGQPVVGSWLTTASPIVAEVMAHAGFRFLVVDAEHSPVSISDTAAILRACSPAAPFVRVPSTNYWQIKRFLDAGATGIIAPLVNSRAQAEEVVSACYFPPKGRRGVGFCRANNYGRSVSDSVAQSHVATTVVVQIEHAAALPHLDEILSTEGLDAVLIGPWDLSASLGHLGEQDHPEVLTAIQNILAACRRHNLAAGIHVTEPSPAEVVHAFRQGFRFLPYSLDVTLLGQFARRGMDYLRQALDL